MISFSIHFDVSRMPLKPKCLRGYKEVVLVWLCFSIDIDWCC